MKRLKESIWPEMTALAVISALVYFARAGGLSYYRDDWYYMYDGLVNGAGVFVEMFAHLRPARGPLFEFLFGLFGTQPLPYHILLSTWRLAGAFGALWLFRLLWPRQRSATFFMALLYLVYPGFLWWVQGFEYQPMVLSAGLQVFSIVFTLKALQSTTRRAWLAWMLAALLTGWASLAYVEYAIGMEAFRWLCVYVWLTRGSHETPLQKTLRSVRALAVPLLVPAFFLFWRVFLFDNQRKAADIGLQTGAALSSPTTLLWWLLRLVQSSLNVSIFAWSLPFNDTFYFLRLRDWVFAAGWALAVLAVSAALHHLTHTEEEAPASSRTWGLEAVSLGLLGVGAGVIPIVIANRLVTFERFSHYALPASLAAVVFVVGLVSLLSDARARMAVLSALVGLSVLTHAALASLARDEERQIQEFWHQVVWRAPDLQAGTVLLVSYPGLEYGEGTDVVWGPTNFIYHPEAQPHTPIQIKVVAARLETDTPKNILEGAQLSQNYIVLNNMQYDFDNLLVMTQPSRNACVHVLDGAWEELSITDTALVGLAAPRSRVEQIHVASAEDHIPPAHIFGPEPAHNWCYFYQKAQLARQQADWESVTKIAEEVSGLGLHPNDPVEWMPFLQAAALRGDEKQVRQIATRINTEQLYKQQACRNLKSMDLTQAMQVQVRELFCGGLP